VVNLSLHIDLVLGLISGLNVFSFSIFYFYSKYSSFVLSESLWSQIAAFASSYLLYFRTLG